MFCADADTDNEESTLVTAESPLAAEGPASGEPQPGTSGMQRLEPLSSGAGSSLADEQQLQHSASSEEHSTTGLSMPVLDSDLHS